MEINNQRIGRAFVFPFTARAKGYLFEVPVQTASIIWVVLSDYLKNCIVNREARDVQANSLTRQTSKRFGG
jgi:mRNA-degrading endonuclease toxin of MazEF toxin-antitoxin module